MMTQTFLDSLYKRVVEIAMRNNCKCEITELYSGNELTDYCKNHSVDIILTDIDMPDISNTGRYQTPNMEGFKAAKELQAENPKTEILFVSAHEELAYQSFRYRPFSFVSKRDLKMLDEDLGELLLKIKKRKTQKFTRSSDCRRKLLCDKYGRGYVLQKRQALYKCIYG